MNWKQFLKPDWRKILLTCLFSFLSPFLIVKFIPGVLDTQEIPLAYGWGEEHGISLEFPVPNIKFFIFFLGLLLPWYLLSCLIIWIYDKVKKK